MARLLLLVLGLWAGISAFLFFSARMNNHPVIIEKILSEGFYYAAIAMAVCHLLTRNKQRRAAKPSEPPPPPEEMSDIHAQVIPRDDASN